MNENEFDAVSNVASNAPSNAATPNTYLGFRIAVGVVGLALLAIFIMLGSVAMKQSATAQALENPAAIGEDVGQVTVAE